MNTPRIVLWDGSNPSVLNEALAVLRRGALLVLPTDTVYGVAADPRVPGAEQRLCRAKGRSRDKPISLLAADCAQIEQWPARLSPAARALARRYWPGALTMVLAASDRPPSPIGSMANDLYRQDLFGADGDGETRPRRVLPLPDEDALSRCDGTAERLHWEGFRIPDHAAAQAVLRAAGGPLRVTSANRSGAPPALTAETAVEALGGAADLALDAGPAPGGRPSTVIRIENGTITILREGAIPGHEILKAYQALTGNRPD